MTRGTPVRPRLVRALTGHTDSVFAVTFSPDGSLVATSSGGQALGCGMPPPA
jgi:WD40 repeat protein